MIEVGILKNFDSGTYKAGVQLAGSLTTYFDDISVAKNIPLSSLVVGNYVILAIPGGNPKDACVIAAWPQGSPGGAEVHGNEYHDPDFEEEGVASSLVETHRTTETHTQPQPPAEHGNEKHDPDFATKADLDSHAYRHESNGADEINLDGLQGAPYDVLPLYKRCMDEWWKTMDGWTQDLAGSGSDSNQLMCLEMQTGTTPDSRVSRYTGPCRGGPHINGQRAIISLWLANPPTDWQFRFYVVHEDESAAPLIDTEEHGGFKIIDGDIYASVANGTDETVQDTGIDFAQGNTKSLEIRGTGSSVEFYVNRELKATIDTNLPQNFGYRIVLELKNSASANKKVRITFCRNLDS